LLPKREIGEALEFIRLGLSLYVVDDNQCSHGNLCLKKEEAQHQESDEELHHFNMINLLVKRNNQYDGNLRFFLGLENRLSSLKKGHFKLIFNCLNWNQFVEWSLKPHWNRRGLSNTRSGSLFLYFCCSGSSNLKVVKLSKMLPASSCWSIEPIFLGRWLTPLAYDRPLGWP
jgi:hypothetical protein